jgi:hypothetical protein
LPAGRSFLRARAPSTLVVFMGRRNSSGELAAPRMALEISASL